MTDALVSASWRLGAVGAGNRGRRRITGDWEVRVSKCSVRTPLLAWSSNMIATTLLSSNVYPMYCDRVLLRDLRRQSPPQHSLGKRLTLRQASRLPLSDWLSCPAQPVYLYTVRLQLSRLNSHHARYRLQSFIATKPHHARYQASKLQ
ncbi:hypothetical protein E2C01_063995 [Portunus trituberculatus]|uniref:Uncharacterized protein n=1 Tax=Portunus trituberculatus TaxID=210409 RepID=A0A5B7HMK4_PORTR|nr:hypothetical protein [Portunus trituberculatus]